MPKTHWPTANIDWTKVHDTYDVELRQTAKGGNRYFVVRLPDGSEAMAMWGGNDARQAQSHLNGLVQRTQKRLAALLEEKSAAWEEHYETCDDPDFCAHDAPGLEEVEELEARVTAGANTSQPIRVYDGRRSFAHDARTQACTSCGAEPEIDKPSPCRAMTGKRPGRAVSYHHKARTLAWFEAGKPRSKFFGSEA